MKDLTRLAAVGAIFWALTAARADAAPRWAESDVEALLTTVAASAEEGLDPKDYDAAGLAQARDAQAADLDALADKIALKLAHDFYEGAAPAAVRTDWHIAREKFDYGAWLDQVLARHSVRASFARLLPTSPAYLQLKASLARCPASPATCQTIAANLDRWRWLPRDLGQRYLWVNVPAYRLDLIEDGRIVASRKVIVGKPGTRTPAFQAVVKAITVNPWWNVPCSIVDESIGKLVRQRPQEAARRGFVSSVDAKGQLVVRQRPGPDNALGRIKLEMPNPYGVYIHDTPARSLFAKDARAFSHGCIRTEEPEELARTLLGPSRAIEVDTLLITGTTRTLPLATALPVYVVYFTAGTSEDGKIETYRDIYGRDARWASYR
ncbi:L,D-transpeptidase family protein [Sphingomonas sp. MMS24-J13]|uniref:L,D-transpeptidase family protein n=1 Tax=Sphingomonas sp. MMS24-J13 TaxID=3238686 RepID=UPI0038518078